MNRGTSIFERSLRFQIRRFSEKATTLLPKNQSYRTDVWKGLENLRSTTVGYVHHWDRKEGWGIIIDEKEKHFTEDAQRRYYCHWEDIAGYNVPWLKHKDRVIFDIVENINDELGGVLNSHRVRFEFSEKNWGHHNTKTRISKQDREMRAINVHSVGRTNWPEDAGIHEAKESIPEEFVRDGATTDTGSVPKMKKAKVWPPKYKLPNEIKS